MNGAGSHCADVGIVSNDDDCGTLPVYIEKKVEYGLPRFGIEGSGRFVGKNQLRAGYEGAGNGNTLLLSARQLAWPMLEPVAQSHFVQFFGGEFFSLGSRNTLIPERQHHIFEDGKGWQQKLLLKDKTDGFITQ